VIWLLVLCFRCIVWLVDIKDSSVALDFGKGSYFWFFAVDEATVDRPHPASRGEAVVLSTCRQNSEGDTV